jgi:tripartite-type tricarboxylate transporter receptor subunit TctC
LEDAQKHEISVGTSGTASVPTFFARLLNETLRTKLKIIPGYPGTSEAFLAMERGELDGYGSAFSSDLTSFKPEWIRDHIVNIVFQYGPEPDPDFASVPFAPDSVKDPADKNLMQAALALLAMGRPFTMPAGVPADRVEAIRKAFAETIRDPDVVAAAKKIGIKLDRGQTGIPLQSIVVKTYETPPALIEKLRLLKTAP